MMPSAKTAGFALVFREHGGLCVSAVEVAMSASFHCPPHVWISPNRKLAAIWNPQCELAAALGRPEYGSPAAWVWGRVEGGCGRAAERLLEDRESAAERLYGDYAWLFWDGSSAGVSVGTDHFGNVPAYYTQMADGFAVSTCLPLLLQMPGSSAVLDYTSLALLIGGQLGPEEEATPYVHIASCAPGTHST